MADLADITDNLITALVEAYIAEIRRKANNIEKGISGECERCGEFSMRLVGGICAPCRDKFKLP